MPAYQMRISDWSSAVCSSDLNRLTRFRVGLLQVDHQQPLGHAHLNGGKANSGSVIHRLKHVIDQLLQIIVDGLYGSRDRSQPRIGRFKDRKKSHGNKIWDQCANIKRRRLNAAGISSDRPSGPERLCQCALVEIIEFARSEEHTSELQSLMRISYAGFC